MKALKTVKVSESTHRALANLAAWGDSMDVVITKLIKSYNEKGK